MSMGSVDRWSGLEVDRSSGLLLCFLLLCQSDRSPWGCWSCRYLVDLWIRMRCYVSLLEIGK